jgi:hypothetical protein
MVVRSKTARFAIEVATPWRRDWCGAHRHSPFALNTAGGLAGIYAGDLYRNLVSELDSSTHYLHITRAMKSWCRTAQPDAFALVNRPNAMENFQTITGLADLVPVGKWRWPIRPRHPPAEEGLMNQPNPLPSAVAQQAYRHPTLA